MTNQGAQNATLNAGQTYTIPSGCHNGNGKVVANSLASQTSGTAAAGNIQSGYTAWVNGSKLTGTLKPSAKITSQTIINTNGESYPRAFSQTINRSGRTLWVNCFPVITKTTSYISDCDDSRIDIHGVVYNPQISLSGTTLSIPDYWEYVGGGEYFGNGVVEVIVYYID